MLRKLCIFGSAGALLSGTTGRCPLQGLLGSNPGQQGAADTDGDGFSDSAELAAGTDSFDPLSHP